MAKVFIEETTLTAIGDAIRSKTGKTELIDPANMSTEIAGIEAGSGGGYEPPAEVLKITGNCEYRFANGGWDWFIKDFGNRVTTENIDDANYMFYYSNIEEIPFQLNLKSGSSGKMNRLFSSCSKLTVCPKVRGDINWSTSSDLGDMLSLNEMLRDMEDVLTPEMTKGYSSVKITSAYNVPELCNPAKYAYSLRRLPSWWYNFKLNPESTAFPAYSYSIYNSAFDYAYVLDEATNIPVWHCQGAQTSNMFVSLLDYTYRLKAFTFETNADGTPIETKWKDQTIDCSRKMGWQTSEDANSLVISYNSGITFDKRVYNDETYQALKNDPDWYACSVAYSRYNHTSAVETINSLPDTSAYLATAGGTNTIKFMGEAGSATDGGAINTLTEAEIAVATAKGWTVTLV